MDGTARTASAAQRARAGSNPQPDANGIAAAMEAMACAVACVVSDSSAVREHAKNEHNAMLVPEGDCKAACTAVRQLLDDETLRFRLVQHGLETAASLDSAKSTRAFLNVVYSTLVSKYEGISSEVGQDDGIR